MARASASVALTLGTAAAAGLGAPRWLWLLLLALAVLFGLWATLDWLWNRPRRGGGQAFPNVSWELQYAGMNVNAVGNILVVNGVLTNRERDRPVSVRVYLRTIESGQPALIPPIEDEDILDGPPFPRYASSRIRTIELDPGKSFSEPLKFPMYQLGGFNADTALHVHDHVGGGDKVFPFTPGQ